MSDEDSLTTTLLRDAVLRVAAPVYLLLALLYLVPVRNAEVQWWLTDFGSTVAMLLLIMWAMQFRLGEVTRPERRFWHLLTVAMGFWLVIHVVYWTIPETGWGPAPGAAGEALFLGYYLCFVLALELRPHRRIAGEEKDLRSRLERFAPVVFVFALLAYFVIVPATLKPERYDTWAPSQLLYVVLDAYLVLRVISLLRADGSPTWSLVYRWMGLALCLFFVTDSVLYLSYAQVVELPDGLGWNLLWMVQSAVLTVAARVRAYAPVPVPVYRLDALGQMRQSSVRSWLTTAYALSLPILAMSLSRFGALDPELDGARDLVLLFALLALGGIAMAHHHLTIRDNVLLERAHLAGQQALIEERQAFARKLERQRAELLPALGRTPGRRNVSADVQERADRPEPSVPEHPPERGPVSVSRGGALSDEAPHDRS